MKPRKGKAVAKKVNGKKVSYGQAGKTPQPGTAKGDAYCARSAGQMKMHNVNCSKTPKKRICAARRRWKC